MQAIGLNLIFNIYFIAIQCPFRADENMLTLIKISSSIQCTLVEGKGGQARLMYEEYIRQNVTQ